MFEFEFNQFPIRICTIYCVFTNLIIYYFTISKYLLASMINTYDYPFLNLTIRFVSYLSCQQMHTCLLGENKHTNEVIWPLQSMEPGVTRLGCRIQPSGLNITSLLFHNLSRSRSKLSTIWASITKLGKLLHWSMVPWLKQCSLSLSLQESSLSLYLWPLVLSGRALASFNRPEHACGSYSPCAILNTSITSPLYFCILGVGRLSSLSLSSHPPPLPPPSRIL